MKSRANFLWLGLALGLVLPIAIALNFEIWAGAKIPELKRSAPLAATAHATPSRLPEPVAAAPLVETPPPAASVATTAEPLPRKSIWNTPLPAPMAAPPSLKLEKHDAGTLPVEAATHEVLSSPAPDSTKAAALLDMLAQIPEESLGQTAEQAVRVLPDRNYAALAFPIITNPRTHGQVLSAMFADLMERPDAVALPTLLKIAETPDHPFAPSAHDNLVLLAGKDLGVDWPAWKDVVFKRVGAGGP